MFVKNPLPYVIFEDKAHGTSWTTELQVLIGTFYLTSSGFVVKYEYSMSVSAL